MGIISAPGATPTIPVPFDKAPIVPETCVPWPCPSTNSLWPLIKLFDQLVFMLRSVCDNDENLRGCPKCEWFAEVKQDNPV